MGPSSEWTRSNKSLVWVMAIAWAAGVGCGEEPSDVPIGDGAQAATEHPSIEDFLEVQGEGCIDDGLGGCVVLIPPMPNIVGWTAQTDDPSFRDCLFIDYAGVANDWFVDQGGTSLGTEISGNVRRRTVSEDTVEVTVSLHTKNAFAYILTRCGSRAGFPETVFGYLPADILAGEPGAVAAIGESHLQVRFLAPDGAPMPDLAKLVSRDPPADHQLLSLQFGGSATGTFREASEFEEGTPGRVQTIQNCRFDFQENSHAGEYGGGIGCPGEWHHYAADVGGP